MLLQTPGLVARGFSLGSPLRSAFCPGIDTLADLIRRDPCFRTVHRRARPTVKIRQPVKPPLQRPDHPIRIPRGEVRLPPRHPLRIPTRHIYSLSAERPREGYNSGASNLEGLIFPECCVPDARNGGTFQ